MHMFVDGFVVYCPHCSLPLHVPVSSKAPAETLTLLSKNRTVCGGFILQDTTLHLLHIGLWVSALHLLLLVATAVVKEAQAHLGFPVACLLAHLGVDSGQCQMQASGFAHAWDAWLSLLRP